MCVCVSVWKGSRVCLCNSYVCLSGRGLVCVALLLYTRTGISSGPEGDKADMVLIFTANLTDFHHFGMTGSFLPNFRHRVSWHAWLSEGSVTHTTKVRRSLAREKMPRCKRLTAKGMLAHFGPCWSLVRAADLHPNT